MARTSSGSEVSKRVKVWFDGQCFQTVSCRRGIGRYAYELVSALARNHPEIEPHISFNAQFPGEALAAADTLAAVIPRDHMHVWHGVATGGETTEGNNAERRFSELALTHHVNCIAPDVALSLSPFEGTLDVAVPLLDSSLLQAPSVGVFYDAIPYRFKDKYLPQKKDKDYYERRLRACGDFKLLLCISEFSLEELKKLLPESKGTNISAGISPQFKELLQKRVKRSPRVAGDYVLYVGGLDWRKNVSLVVDAFAELPLELSRDLKFVIAGDHDAVLLAELKARWRHHGLNEQGIISLGHVSDSGLVDLYADARLLVQPSLMEGFGLTAIEALICCTPVAAADAGALPETVGSKDMLFDPTSPKSLADCIMSLSQDSSVREKVLQHGLAQSEKFTWERTAEIVAEELARVASESHSTSAVSKEELDLYIAREANKLRLNSRHAATALALAELPNQISPRLLIDVSISAVSPAHSGIQRVVRKITSNLGCNDSANSKLIFNDGRRENGWIELDSAEYHRTPPKSKENVTVGPKDHLLMLDSSWNLIEGHLPLLYDARLRGAQVTFCIFDLIPLTASAFCVQDITNSYRNWFLKALEVATGFICISKAVADELLELLALIEFPREVAVDYWRLGADFNTKVAIKKPSASDMSGRAKAGVTSQTDFLMVGTLEPRKGYALALDAFEELWANGGEVSLTMVGRPGWFIHTLSERIRKHPEFGRRLHWYDDASDEELDTLYQRSDCLIAASYAEGFGLPIVEAGQMGKPVIASDLPVFREVAAGARSVSFFKAGSSKSLAVTVDEYQRGGEAVEFAASKAFPSWPSWEESAQELLEVVSGSRPYKMHQVKTEKTFSHPAQLGKLLHDDALPAKSRKLAIRVVDGPSDNDERSSQRFVVEVTNKSTVPWFGTGPISLSNSVALSYHLLTIDGAVLQYENPRTAIPLTLGPGCSTYLSVEIPIKWIRRGARFVELELVQEGRAWFGNSLRLDLGEM